MSLAANQTAQNQVAAETSTLANLVASAPALAPVTTIPTPNILYVSQVIVQGGLVNGAQAPSFIVTLSAAVDNGDGTLTPTGQSATVMLDQTAGETGVPDSLASIFASLQAVAATVNASRNLI